MAQPIYHYEMELKVTPHGRPAFVQTRKEWGYSVSDAYMIGVMNVIGEQGGGDVKVELKRIGPPLDVVAEASRAEAALLDAIGAALSKALASSGAP